NPTKLKREVDESDREDYEREYRQWEALAEYAHATRNGGPVLTDDERAAAHAAYKPRAPGWERTAEAIFARENGKIELSTAERNEARVLQDDRQTPAAPPVWWETRVMTSHDLANFPRTPDIDQTKSRKLFAE